MNNHNPTSNSSDAEVSAAGPLSRRKFLLSASAALLTAGPLVARAAGASTVAPVTQVGKALRLAGVGVGGVGFTQLQELERAGFKIVALCDVDHVYAKRAFDKWPVARRYTDFREMLRVESSEIDAVYVGTPDHTHAIVTLAALRQGKHVCCVKPLTKTIEECRTVVTAAREAGVVTQVTADPYTNEIGCRTRELIQAGAIGAVREVHIWTDRPYWPHAMVRPLGEDIIPDSFDWRLWIGPAPMRPFKGRWPDGDCALRQTNFPPGQEPFFKSVYHPFNFRGWWDFGTGALGDMGCHYFNVPFRALNLSHPKFIQAVSTKADPQAAPLASIVTYDFPAENGRAAVRVVWYDGGLKPVAPEEIGHRKLPEEGVLYLGDQGKMIGPKLLDPVLAEKFRQVPRTLPRTAGTWAEWYQACQGGEPPSCSFEWAGLLTEAVLLGNIAIRTGRPLEWDAAGMRFVNDKAADEFLKASYQNGWSLSG